LAWASEGGAWGPNAPPGILKLLAKNVVFLVFSGKKQVSLLLPPPRKILENPLVAPPGKNPSDAHDTWYNATAD